MLVYQFYKMCNGRGSKRLIGFFKKKPEPRIKFYFVHSKTMFLMCLDQTQI